jgi:hypothetical protein
MDGFKLKGPKIRFRTQRLNGGSGCCEAVRDQGNTVEVFSFWRPKLRLTLELEWPRWKTVRTAMIDLPEEQQAYWRTRREAARAGLDYDENAGIVQSAS